MKRFIGLVLCWMMVGVLACQKAAPEPTIDRTKLIGVLIDVHLAEAAIANVFGSARDSLAVVYYDQIYEIHQIDSTIFQEQVSILRKNPVYMRTLYEDVLNEVNKLDATKK